MRTMENGEGNMERRFAGLAVSDPAYRNGNDGLYQVMKAVEAAEATIKQQVEENIRLRSELQKKIEELDKYKSGDQNDQSPQAADRPDDLVDEPSIADQLIVGNQNGGIRSMDINNRRDLVNSAGHKKDMMRNGTNQAIHSELANFGNFKDNGSLGVNLGGQVAPESSAFTQFVSPPVTPFFASRSALEGDSDSQLGISGTGLMAIGEVTNSNSTKQDLAVKIREHEEEIMQLKKHLTEYSIKESQIYNEKYVLEKRISYMRMAFDQQQQDLVDAASKAISYRQEIMEENVRLTYALQAAQQERSMFVSSLMPLLAEYSLQPPVDDAQSIVSNVKVLFRHLKEQLLITEGKLKDSQYQLAPWRSDVNLLNFPQSPVYPIEMKNGLELVPQPTYSNGKTPALDHRTPDGDLSSRPQSAIDDVMRNFQHDDMESYSPLASRNTTSQEVHGQLVGDQAELHSLRNNEENVSKKVTFGDLVKSSEMDEPDTRGHQSDREALVNWTSKPSTYPLEDPNSSYSPYLPPVLEEPSSSFSEAADDDPPPGIEDLQITGEAFPGRQLQACGYSTNGTTSCNFEWVRHLEDGSFNYIEGAKQPNYLVNADDINTCLAIEVQPLDDRKRKGELVKVFANNHQRITCDPEMQSCIERTLYSGHTSYKLSLLSTTGILDIWESATLAIKRDSYSIKCTGPSGVLITEKFSPSIVVSIPYGNETEFSIVDSQGIERVLKVENGSTDTSGKRDTIVLTLRLFIMKAGEKKKVKKRGIFFK